MSDEWKTPEWLYSNLDREFRFDFDPCPLGPGFDGLECEWGQRNFVNPPYSRKLKSAFVIRAANLAQFEGKMSVLLLPTSTSSDLFHQVILPNSSEIRFIRGRVKFAGKTATGAVATDSAAFDSMVVVFRGLDHASPYMRSMDGQPYWPSHVPEVISSETITARYKRTVGGTR